MKEKDLRVIKTKENIEAALLELLKNRTIDKVTVVELSRTAKINKSTFYLHYQDIHDLYRQTVLKKLEEPFRSSDFFPDFFFAPERFMERLGEAVLRGLPAVKAMTHDKDDPQCVRGLISILCRKIYETGLIEKNEENDMKLETVFAAILYVMPRHRENLRDEAHVQMASIIHLLFPASAS